jgi:chloramphenicol 3-O-phosphotransferase
VRKSSPFALRRRILMDHQGHILILTGPPGSGKTTTAAALADDFWHVIRHGAIPPYLPEAHGQNAVVMEALARAAAAYAAGGYFVVLDGIVGPWFLAPFRAIDAPVHYVVLRPSLEAAVARCQARGGDTLTDAATIAELHRQFASLGALEKHVLAVDGCTREEARLAVADAVRGGAFRLAG